MLKFTVPVLLFGLLAGAAIAAGNDAGPAMDSFSLPPTTSPTFYELQFTPKFNGFNSTFTGVANITISINSRTDVITLNSKELKVTNVTVTDVTRPKPKSLGVRELRYIAHNEQLEIYLNRFVPQGYTLLVSIRYEGKIRTDMAGLYISSYVENNQTKWLAVTQFQPADARSAFPCYDEPSYKTPFNISVVKQKNLTALSNMPVQNIKVSSDPQTETVYFKTTPPMSTYLTAIYVGEFVPSNNDSSIKVYTHADYANQTKYIDTEAPKHMAVLEKYLGIKYLLPKMDLLGIPDFQAGAMENWGMNTYREYYMLLDDLSKTKMKIRASAVVQHEFTHQWFGNLVTCKKWDYTWLNEGFARYFQYFATEMVRTTWPMKEWFVVEAFQAALAYDQTPRHAITSSVKTPREIESNFDAITYSKAASVLRMLKHLVTERLFQESLQEYLSSLMITGVAEPDDLFASFDDTLEDNGYKLNSGLSVKEFMSNWTLQPGYPVLYVTKNKTQNTFILTQKRFFVNATYDNGSDTSAWHIGITFTTQKNKNFNYTLPSAWTNTTSKTTVLPAPKESGWHVFNIQATGFYRVNYDTENWNALIKQLHEAPEEIHVLNRAQLIDDAFALAKAGQLNYTVPLNLTKYLKNENNTIPWYSAMNGFSYLLERMPRSEKGYANLKAHARRLAGIIYKKLDTLVSKGNTDYVVKAAYDAFSTWALGLDDKHCNKTTYAYFQKWHKEKQKISPDIKDAAFCAGLKNADHAGCFNMMFKVYTIRSKSISEKISAQSALGCSNNRSQLAEYVHHLLDGPQGPIKEKDYGAVVSAVSVTPLGIGVLQEFLYNHLNDTLKTNNGESTVTFIYSTLASKAATHYDIEKLRQLKDNPNIPDSVRASFNKSFEKIHENLKWFDQHSEVIGRWAEENLEPEEEQKEEEETTTLSPTTASSTKPHTNDTTTVAPKPSSGTSTIYGSFVILQFTVITSLLIKSYVF